MYVDMIRGVAGEQVVVDVHGRSRRCKWQRQGPCI